MRQKKPKLPKLPTPLPTGSEWSFDSIQAFDDACKKVADRFSLDSYPHQLEIISAEQMMDAYASIGMPVFYHHWSFGKSFLATENKYKRGYMGLAYEIVINSDPCIAYLMEENTLTMQALVIAHAAYGHNSFFKGNHLFKQWTSPDSIIDYLVFAKNFITECEEKYGQETVEKMLDACHALMNLGVDRHRRAPKLSMVKEKLRQKEREEYLQSQVNELWKTLPFQSKKEEGNTEKFPKEPEENVLYFIEKNAPLLEPWQREIIRIVRKIAQYFHPQKQTQLMNEGWACFWHYKILNTLYDDNLVGDGFMLEFLQSHTNVCYQPAYSSKWYSGISPYAFGFAMWQDIKRICEKPTKEDSEWFPSIAGSDWRETLEFAMNNFKDESFVSQYLSPKMMRDFHLFSVLDDDEEEDLIIGPIHDEVGYYGLRQRLSDQYNLGSREPNIQVWNLDKRGDRTLTLRYFSYHRKPLYKDFIDVVKYTAYLWGFPVALEEQDETGFVDFLGMETPEI
jgi:spore cortex formation protein SpoVR/YcgB (stage V sporulation)